MKKNNNKFIGIIFISLAIYLLLSMFGADLGDLPHIFLGGVAFIGAIYSLYNRNFFNASFALSISIFFTYHLIPIFKDVTHISIWTLFFFSILLGIGLQLVFGKNSFKRTIIFENNSKSRSNHSYDESSDNSDYVNIDVSIGETTRYLYSPNLKEVNIDSSLGSASVYFQERTLNNDLNINVDCSMGNISLYLPREWNIQDNINVSLGHFEVDKDWYNNDTKSPFTVYLNGSVSLGHLEINFI